ncbi:hypothetical protein M6B38_187520 [Iris pallida]|uniref:Uncharacterized protein n=1 Tax=Iris pallida TaxID=29817 RepID=A0AAX6EIQ2_IRIPA|nr:hypothetical protein M6B38_187520 [Iris pallida]
MCFLLLYQVVRGTNSPSHIHLADATFLVVIFCRSTHLHLRCKHTTTRTLPRATPTSSFSALRVNVVSRVLLDNVGTDENSAYHLTTTYAAADGEEYHRDSPKPCALLVDLATPSSLHCHPSLSCRA